MRNKKGFTLVELLAVVVILGIIMTVSIPAVNRWINRSKGQSKDAQQQTLLVAAQNYAQGNSKVLPKTIGETTFIKAKDLKKANYLKEDLVDSDKKDCMKDSVVRIYKYDKEGYSYTAYLYCEGDEVPDEIEGIKPLISISFVGDNIRNETIQDVSTSGFRATIEGGVKEGKNLGIDGYNYSISVRYAGTGEIVEIFNSGSLNAGGKEKLVIEKNLSEYTDISTESEYIVTVEAYNRDGGYFKQTASSKYGDNNGPTCGEITGQAGENEWFNTPPHAITISVKCIDEENGSGCVKDVFTQTFDQQMNMGTIQIKDNAGNTTDCKVRVHNDWTKPTLTVTAYVRKSDGTKGSQVGTVTASHSNPNVTLNSYTGNSGGWLGSGNFPYGVYYEMTTSDNILLGSGTWFYNGTGIYSSSASNINDMTTGDSKSYSVNDNVGRTYLSGEGLRRAKYVLRDKAGNSVTVNIAASIDRTSPTCSTSKSHLNTTSGVTVSITCRDGGSGCSSSNTLSYSGIKSSRNFSVKDVADNQGSCGVSVIVTIQKRTRTWNKCHHKIDVCAPAKKTKHWTGITAGAKCSANCEAVCTCTDTATSGGDGSISASQSCSCFYTDPCGTTKKQCVGDWDPWGSWYTTSGCSESDSVDCRNLYS